MTDTNKTASGLARRDWMAKAAASDPANAVARETATVLNLQAAHPPFQPRRNNVSTTFQRFVTTQSLGIAAFNAGINALYTWGLWRSKSILTLFGENAIAFDLSSTSGWIAALSTLLGTGAIRGKLRDGRVAAPRMRSTAPFDMLPLNIAARACILGLASAIVLGTPVWLILRASGIGDVSLGAAVLAKIAITVPMSLLIVPLVILAGLSDVQRGRRTAAIA